MATEITEAELILVVLRQAAQRPDRPAGLLTVEELVAATGIPERRVRRQLSGLKAQKLLRTDKVPGESISGYPIRIPGYGLIRPVAAEDVDPHAV